MELSGCRPFGTATDEEPPLLLAGPGPHPRCHLIVPYVVGGGADPPLGSLPDRDSRPSAVGVAAVGPRGPAARSAAGRLTAGRDGFLVDTELVGVEDDRRPGS